MARRIKLKIKRCDPSSEESCEPYWQAYDVSAEEGMTVLEALLEISTREDATLSFRRSCRSAICGSCAVKINGFPKLSCSTQIIPEFEKRGHLSIEPLDNMRVIKDLVVEQDSLWSKMEKVTPYLTPLEEEECKGGCDERVKITKEDAARVDDVQRCIMCGACNSACNSMEIDPKYIGPAASAKAWRFVGDVREGHKEKRLARLSLEHGIWDCVRCYHCTEYCPKDVEPLEAIETLKAAAMEEGVIDNDGARHSLALVESVKRVGRLDEAAMTFKTLGFLRSLGMIPFGIRMEAHGKMPHPIIFPAIEEIEEVRKIYEKRQEDKKKGGGG